MKYPHIPFLLLLIFSAIPLYYDWAVSVIPGWNTLITPFWPPYPMIVWPWLALVTVVYWLCYRRQQVITLYQYLTHLVVTLVLMIPLRFPQVTILSNAFGDGSAVDLYNWTNTTTNVLSLAFSLVQLCFIVYLFAVATRPRDKRDGVASA